MNVKTLLSLIATAAALAPVEPPTGKRYLGAWLDTSDASPTLQTGDRPRLLNQRLGFNISVIQYAQDLPLAGTSFPYDQIQDLQSDTIVYLTIYPKPDPWNIQDSAISELTAQIASLTQGGRQVLIRFAPEMNGNWMVYGVQPMNYVALWKRFHKALKAVAPTAALCWAPNEGAGYPFGQGRSGLSSMDFALM
ncbi:hypothetical protein HDU91_004857, partial [Kappamyces sp. JEL0680]